MIKSSSKAQARRRIISKLDGLVRQLVLARDGCCQRCGKTENLQAAHILPKGHYPRLRFELLNVIVLCINDHLFFAHKDPIGFAAWLENKWPGRAQDLQVMAATAPRIDMKELMIALQIETRKL